MSSTARAVAKNELVSVESSASRSPNTGLAFRGSVSVRFLKRIFPRLPAKRAIVYSAQERKKKEMSPDDNEVPLYHFRRNGNQQRSQKPNPTTNSAAVSLRKRNCVLRELLKCEKKTQIKEFKEREREKKGPG